MPFPLPEVRVPLNWSPLNFGQLELAEVAETAISVPSVPLWFSHPAPRIGESEGSSSAAILPQSQDPPLHPAWRKAFRLGGTSLIIQIWTKRNEATEVELVQNGSVIKRGRSDFYFDGTVSPYLHTVGKNAFLAFAAGPGAGSGQYASVWKMSKNGHALDEIGVFRDADLSQWFRTGLIQEFRPAKYATADMIRRFGYVWEEPSFRFKKFILTFRFDSTNGRFKINHIRVVPFSTKWPDQVRFPIR